MNAFYTYFVEIKNRLILILLAWFSIILIGYIYKETLLFLIIKSYCFYEFNISYYFIFTNITEMFTTYIQLINCIAIQIIIFFIFYHTISFLAPGLYTFEFEYLSKVFFMSIFFWAFSIFVLNTFFLPTCWEFFLSFQKPNTNLYFEAKINEYLHFYLISYYICSLNFQMFMVLILFFNYINGDLLIIKELRKIFYFIFLIFSTVITPPDILSQITLLISVISIFEFLIFSVVLKNRLNTNKATN